MTPHRCYPAFQHFPAEAFYGHWSWPSWSLWLPPGQPLEALDGQHVAPF